MSKLTFKLMIFTLCLSVAVVSCKKDKDEPDPTPPTNNGGGNGGGGEDSTAYSKNLTFVLGQDSLDFTKNATISFSGNKITILGDDGTASYPQHSIRITLPDTMRQVKYLLATVPGTFIKINYYEKLNANSTNKYEAIGGNFIIDSINVSEKYLKANFQFSGFQAGGIPIQVNNGKLELKEE